MTTATLTIDEVIGLPLPQLLDRANAEIHQLPIEDPRFFGSARRHAEDGRLLLALASGRDEVETRCTVRFLIAQWFRLGLTSFPPHLEVSELDQDGNVISRTGGPQPERTV